MILSIEPTLSIQQLIDFYSIRTNYKYILNSEGPNQDIIDHAGHTVLTGLGSHSDARLGMSNFLDNFSDVLKSPDFSELEVYAKDIIIVQAGPGLYADIDAVKKHADKGAFIIACDAVLKVLLEYKIIPNIIVTCEREELTSSFFEDRDLSSFSNTLLVASVYTHPKILSLWPFRKAFMKARLVEMRWIPWTFESFFASIPCVSSLALILAKKLCAERVFLVGQDLAYHPYGRSHTNLFNERFNGYDTPDQDKISGTQWMVKGNHLNEVLTNSIWQQFSQDLTRLSQGIEVYTTSINGAAIDNIPFKSLRDVEIDYESSDVKIMSNLPKVDKQELNIKIDKALISLEKEFDLEDPHVLYLGYTLVCKELALREISNFRKGSTDDVREYIYEATKENSRQFLIHYLNKLKDLNNS